MTTPNLDEMLARHLRPENREVMLCADCGVLWPCDAAKLLDHVEALTKALKLASFDGETLNCFCAARNIPDPGPDVHDKYCRAVKRALLEGKEKAERASVDSENQCYHRDHATAPKA